MWAGRLITSRTAATAADDGDMTDAQGSLSCPSLTSLIQYLSLLRLMFLILDKQSENNKLKHTSIEPCHTETLLFGTVWHQDLWVLENTAQCLFCRIFNIRNCIHAAVCRRLSGSCDWQAFAGCALWKQFCFSRCSNLWFWLCPVFHLEFFTVTHPSSRTNQSARLHVCLASCDAMVGLLMFQAVKITAEIINACGTFIFCSKTKCISSINKQVAFGSDWNWSKSPLSEHVAQILKYWTGSDSWYWN